MVKQKSLKELNREIAREKTELARLQERERLEKQLRQLKSSKRTDISNRIGRGFVILSKKAGGMALKQAQAIRQRQIKESKRKNKKNSLSGRDNIFAPLDF